MDMTSFKELSGVLGIHPVWIGLAIVWVLIWKGLALWCAAQLQQKNWFVALMIVNTLGLLEIFYLFVISKKYEVEIVEENG